MSPRVILADNVDASSFALPELALALSGSAAASRLFSLKRYPPLVSIAVEGL